MSEREDNVYKAKLAEQAERYDGMFKVLYKSDPKGRYLLRQIAEVHPSDYQD